MFQTIRSFYSYSKLLYKINNYYSYFQENKEHNINLIQDITESVTICGSVAIKFCQWITPKLEIMHLNKDNILSEEKPKWLLTLEKYYENCEIHSLDYTKQEYMKVFGESIDDTYKIQKIIGSGSIGQVYLVYNKNKQQEEVIKIIHPNVMNEIQIFQKIVSFLMKFPCIHKKYNQLLPFDINGFVDQFLEQTDLVNEANHMLYFYEKYKENQFIIIPRVLRISSSILIMSHEEGIPFDKLTMNDYQKDKIVNLFHLFIRSNLMLYNYNHGDLHSGNWKIKMESDENHKLIIYDFGFCWKISKRKFETMGNIFVDTFEEANTRNKEVSIQNLCKLMYFVIICNQSEDQIKSQINEFIQSRIDTLQPWRLSPIALLKATIDFCLQESLFIDPILIQSFIIIIQGQKLFERYGLMGTNDETRSDYEVYRERYLNILTFCKTYTIFDEYSQYIENKLNEKQLQIDTIFDTIQMNDAIKQLALE